MGNEQSRVYMDHENQQYVRTRRRTSRDRPRQTQSIRNQAPRLANGQRDSGERGQGQAQNSHPQAPPEEEVYCSEDEYGPPPMYDERPHPRRDDAQASYSESMLSTSWARGREGTSRSVVTRQYMPKDLDSRGQAQYEQRPSRIEREWVSMSENRGPPPNLEREHSRRDQSAMPAPLNVPRQGFRPEMMRAEQVRGRFPFQISNGANADFGRSIIGVQAETGPSRSGVAGGGGGTLGRPA